MRLTKWKVASATVIASLMLSTAAFACQNGQSGKNGKSGGNVYWGTNPYIWNAKQNTWYGKGSGKGMKWDWSYGKTRSGFGMSYLKELAKALGIDLKDITPGKVTEAISAALEKLDSDKLLKLAEKMGIDADDMTDKEIISAIKEKIANGPFGNKYWDYKCGVLYEIAEILEIDTTDLDYAGVKEAVSDALEELDSEELIAVAKGLGIDTEDMTDEKIISAIEEKITKDPWGNFEMGKKCGTGRFDIITEALGIDITDMEYEEVTDAVSDALLELDSDALIELAESLGMDPEDMTEKEIIDKVEKIAAFYAKFCLDLK